MFKSEPEQFDRKDGEVKMNLEVMVWAIFLILLGMFIGAYWSYLQGVSREIEDKLSATPAEEKEKG